MIKPLCENVIAIPHSNNKDFWVIVHGKNNNNFYMFLVSENGVSLTPIINSIGIIYNTVNDYTCCFSYSKCGKKLVSSVYTKATYEIFDFDNNTGNLSNLISLFDDTFYFAYDNEFSPDMTKLYATSRYGPSRLYQFDLTLKEADKILNSKIILSTHPDRHFYGSLQLGPNGKIYHAMQGSEYLGVINNPDSLGTKCNYVEQGVYLGGRTSFIGLPNFVQANCGSNNTILKPEIQIVDFNPCTDTSVTLITQSGYFAYYWYYLDEHNLIETAKNRIFVFKSGKYYVKVMNETGETAFSDTLSIKIGKPKFIEISAQLSDNELVFDSTTISTTNSKNISIKNIGAGLYKITPYLIKGIEFSFNKNNFPIFLAPGDAINLQITFTPKSIGTFVDTLVVKDSCDSYSIALTGSSKEMLINKPTIIVGNSKPCSNDPVRLSTQTGYANYYWYDAENGTMLDSSKSSVMITVSGKYYVKVISTFGQIAFSDTITVNIGTQKFIEISGLFNSSELVFDSTIVSSTSYKNVTIKNIGIAPYKIAPIIVRGFEFSFPKNQFPMLLLPNDSIDLMISFTPITYGIFKDTLIINDSCDQYIIHLFGFGKEKPIEKPFISFNTPPPCENDSVTISANGGYPHYYWYFAGSNELIDSSKSSIIVKKSGQYYLKVMDDFGKIAFSDTVSIFIGKPKYIELQNNIEKEGLVFDSQDSSSLLSQKIGIKNIGSTPFNIKPDLFKGIEFSYPKELFPMMLAPEDSVDIIVTFSPMEVGTFRDTLFINDTCLNYLIPLTGLNNEPKINKPIITISKVNPCSTNSMTLTVDEDYPHYYWYDAKNANLIDSAKSSIIVSDIGEYYVKVKSKYGQIAFSDTISVSFGFIEMLQVTYEMQKEEMLFDSIAYFSSVCKKFKVKNIGKMQITVDPYMLKGDAFNIPQNKLPAILQKGDSIELEVCYYPPGIGTQLDTLLIQDKCDFHYIPVHGNCIKQQENDSTKSEPNYIASPPFPNPANSEIVLPLTFTNTGESINLRWEIFDNLGSSICKGNAELKVSEHFVPDASLYNEIRINTRGIQSGFYLLVLNDGLNSKTLIITIEK
ncbi:MAG: choice-of-anchor D domain-containing protein [Bacteroidota bacterium]